MAGHALSDAIKTADLAVTVVVPAYNAEATIGQALESVLTQRHQNFHIVVVDDGSTDQTARVVRLIAANEDRITLVEQANAGPAAARNRAVAQSSAPFIAPLDADDVWHPAYLEKLMRAIGEEDFGFAYALHRTIDDDGRVLRNFPCFGCAGRVLYRHALVNFVGTGSAALFRRDALLKAGGFDERTRAWGGGEDYLLQLRIAAFARVAVVPEYLVGYRKLAESYSSDPLRARNAQVNVVTQIASEIPCVAPVICRWVRSDAERTAAFKLLGSRHLRKGAVLLPPALRADPHATVADVWQRMRNALSNRRAADSLAGRPFSSLDPLEGGHTQCEGLLARRLERLRRLDEDGLTPECAAAPANA